MSKTTELLEAVKAAKGIETKYGLAKYLGIPTQRISDYYNAKTYPDNDACLKIASALNKNLTEVIALVQMDSAKSEERREAWKEYYKSIGGIAAGYALIIFFAVTSIVTPTPALASTGAKADLNDLYYVK